MSTEPTEKLAVDMHGITKAWPGVVANDHVDFSVRAGEIHALVGENGAGKSTLMNILYGLVKSDSGEIIVNGKPARINGPRDAIALGIGMVHQHFMLIPVFTVGENIMLGREPVAGPGFYDYTRARKDIDELTKKYGLRLDPDARTGDLPVGLQQRAEIVKVLYRGANLLVLRIQPNEGASLAFQAKIPGSRRRLQEVRMDFRYGTAFAAPPPEALRPV